MFPGHRESIKWGQNLEDIYIIIIYFLKIHIGGRELYISVSS